VSTTVEPAIMAATVPKYRVGRRGDEVLKTLMLRWILRKYFVRMEMPGMLKIETESTHACSKPRITSVKKSSRC
jgi:hypothetical protein